MKFFEEYYDNGLLNVLDNGKLGIVQKTWDKIYTKGMDPMRDYIKANLTELLEKSEWECISRPVGKICQWRVK